MDVKKEHLDEPFETQDIESFEGSAEGKRKPISSLFTKANLYEAALGAIYMICGALLGAAEFLFGSHPFGVAFLCAGSRKIAYIYLGLCLSALISLSPSEALVYICIYTSILLIRVISRLVVDSTARSESGDSKKFIEIYRDLFSEHILLRMSTSCVGAFALGIYTLALGGFLYYDLYAAIASMIAAPAAVFLYRGFLESKDLADGATFAGFCAISASLTLALESVGADIFGVSLSLFFSMFLMLYVCRKRSMLHGVIFGTCCGLAYSPMTAPLFAFAALSAGALWRVSVFFASISAFSVGIAWGLYVNGISALTELMPALLAASLLYAVTDKLFLSSAKKDEAVDEAFDDDVIKKESSAGTDVLGRLRFRETEQKIQTIRETFSSLSELFYGMSERMRTPSNSDLKQICSSAFEKCCEKCELRTTCWEIEYASTLSAVGRMATSLGKNGRVLGEDIPLHLSERCENMQKIVKTINRDGAAYVKQLLEGDKTEIFALDYDAVSKLLGDAMESQKGKFAPDAELGEAFLSAVSEKGIDISGVFAFGEKEKKIVVCAKDKDKLCEALPELQSIANRLCGTHMKAELYESEDSEPYAVISRERRFSIDFAKRTCPAEGGDGFCGDTVNVFEENGDLSYSLISDGMGSGRDAAFTSGICSIFLSKMLSATDRCDVALQMLNGFLRNNGGTSMHECSATVDLMELDMLSGKATFYKGGAAPSYVWRDNNLFKLRSSTVPLGIIKELEANKISLDMGHGDIVVMVSDGVTGSQDECPWLFELLKESVGSESLASIADRIVKRAKYEGSDDDISVIVMQINEASLSETSE